MPEMLTVKELREMLKVSDRTIYRWVNDAKNGDGTLPFYNVNGMIRFDREEIRIWLESQKTTVAKRDM